MTPTHLRQIKSLLQILFIGWTCCTNAQEVNHFQVGIGISKNTNGDLISSLFRNTYVRDISRRFGFSIELHLLNGSDDELGLTKETESQPFLFISQFNHYPLGFKPGDYGAGGIHFQKPITERNTVIGSEIGPLYHILVHDRSRLSLGFGILLAHVNNSTIWEYGPATINGINVLYVVPGNYRYLDIGYYGTITYTASIFKHLCIQGRLAAHGTPKSGQFYPEISGGIQFDF